MGNKVSVCLSGTQFLLNCEEKLRGNKATGTTPSLTPPTLSSSISMETQRPGNTHTHTCQSLGFLSDLGVISLQRRPHSSALEGN